MNYLSQPAPVYQPVEMGGNLQLAIGVATNLQSRYDANKSIVDQTIAQYESLRGLTDTDNAYIAAQVSNIKNQVNKLGGLNLAYNTGRDTVLNNMKNILRDPIVTDILVSKANVDSLNAEYQKIKEKDPSKDNKANLDFALEQGGYFDYLQGKTKKVGSMSYTPYENVTANYSKRLKEYVEQYDDEQYLGNESKGKYHTVDIYGKVVLKEDLENFLKTTTTPQEMNQLHINAWDKYRGIDDTKVTSLLKPAYEKELASYKEQESTLKAKADSGDKDAKSQLKIIRNNIENTSSKINKGGFTKNDLYQIETEGFIKNMASLYDKNIITKKDVDNAIFDEVKFEQSKMEFELSYDQKERANKIAEKANDLTQQQMLGTLTDVPKTDKEKPKSEFQTFNEEKDATYDKLVGSLSATDSDFAKMTSQQKRNYILNLDLSDPANIQAKGITKEIKDLHTSFIKKQNIANDHYTKSLLDVEKTAITSFQDMQESVLKSDELKVDKISKFLPYTAQVLKMAKKDGKAVSWDSLPTDAKYAIQAEMLAQHQNESELDWDTQKTYNTMGYLLKSKIQNKAVLGVLDNAQKSNKKTGYWENVGNLGSNIWGSVKDLANDFRTIGTAIGEGTQKANEDYAKYKQSKVEDFSLSKLNPITYLHHSISDRVLSEEEDLHNIEARDLLGKENIGKRFDTFKDIVSTSVKRQFGSESPYQKSVKAVSFSTTNKYQKDTANLIRQTIMATNPDAPIPEGDNYIIKQEGAGFRVTYQVKDKEKGIQNAEPVYLSKLPDALQTTFQQKQDVWEKSVYNPNFKVPNYSFAPIDTPEKSAETLDKLVYYGGLDETMAEFLIKSPYLLPTNTYVNNVVPKEVQNKNKEAIERFKKQTFKTKSSVTNGKIYSVVTYNDLDNGEILQKTLPPFNTAQEQVEDIDVQLHIMDNINDIKMKQLTDLK